MEPDVDGEAAIATRKRIFDRWRPTDCSLPACTCTFRDSSISIAAPNGGYELVPEIWNQAF